MFWTHHLDYRPKTAKIVRDYYAVLLRDNEQKAEREDQESQQRAERIKKRRAILNGKSYYQRIIGLAREEREHQTEIERENTRGWIFYGRVRNDAEKRFRIAQIAAREARKRIKSSDESAITRALRARMAKLDASIKSLLDEAKRTQERLLKGKNDQESPIKATDQTIELDQIEERDDQIKMEEDLHQALQVVNNEFTLAQKARREEAAAASNNDHQEVEVTNQAPIEQPQKSQSTPNKLVLSRKTTAKLLQISEIPGVSRNAARGQNNGRAGIKTMPNVLAATIEQKEIGALLEIETAAENKGCRTSKGGDDESRRKVEGMQ